LGIFIFVSVAEIVLGLWNSQYCRVTHSFQTSLGIFRQITAFDLTDYDLVHCWAIIFHRSLLDQRLNRVSTRGTLPTWTGIPFSAVRKLGTLAMSAHIGNSFEE
jgi:hypothetical protein